jgi:hypothetical protein
MLFDCTRYAQNSENCNSKYCMLVNYIYTM